VGRCSTASLHAPIATRAPFAGIAGDELA